MKMIPNDYDDDDDDDDDDNDDSTLDKQGTTLWTGFMWTKWTSGPFEQTNEPTGSKKS